MQGDSILDSAEPSMGLALKLTGAIFMAWGLSACSIHQAVLKAKYANKAVELCAESVPHVQVYYHEKDKAQFHLENNSLAHPFIDIAADNAYELTSSKEILEGGPDDAEAKLLKHTTTVLRKSDNKLLGVAVNYWQVGGDFGALETYKPYYCVHPTVLEQQLLHQIFSEK